MALTAYLEDENALMHARHYPPKDDGTDEIFLDMIDTCDVNSGFFNMELCFEERMQPKWPGKYFSVEH